MRRVVAGGLHRQDSVGPAWAARRGVRYVAVHDAARPLDTPGQIEGASSRGAGERGRGLGGAGDRHLKRATEERVVCESIERDGVYAMQTPQIFSRDLLAQAYALVAAQKLSITDEVSAVQPLGRTVVLVPNEEFNFKITFPADLALAEFVLAQRAR